MNRPIAQCLVLASLVVGSPPVHAQKDKGKEPKRPELAATADTNHAAAYYYHGLSMVERNPRKAADAFYWAARLDPTWAQPWYARRVALLMADQRFLIGYMERRRRFIESKEGRRLDSLELRARMLNPFVLRELDKHLITAYVMAVFEDQVRRSGRMMDVGMRSEFQFFLERYLRAESSARMKAVLAVSERRLPEAIEQYRRAIAREKKDEAAELHLERGRAFFLIGSNDSARAEIELALDELRQRDAKDFVFLYESKGVLEHAIGVIHEAQQNPPAAREAYGRALQEDLSYYPAHVRLGLLALADGDTATALSEMDLAVQIEGNDAWVRSVYAATLTQGSRFAEAEGHLRRAVELEPFYAAPRYLLGRVAELSGQPAEAIEHYRAYVARADSRAPALAEAKERLAVLGALAEAP